MTSTQQDLHDWDELKAFLERRNKEMKSTRQPDRQSTSKTACLCGEVCDYDGAVFKGKRGLLDTQAKQTSTLSPKQNSFTAEKND